jgi:hypothetical protein
MNPCALGWDNHRKFSKVSLMEQTPEGDTPPPRPGSRPGRPEPEESPTAKTTLRSDQPRHPMVRRRATVGQTRV